MINLYRNEKMSPFSGCLTAIIQFILLISVFYLVKSPLTFMQKVPAENIGKYTQQLQEANKTLNNVYPEIDLIREYEFLKEKNPEDGNIEKLNLKMDFLGLDLSKVPQQNMGDYKVYIIPILYIISSFISIRMSTSMQEKMNKKNKEKDNTIVEDSTGKELIVKEENEIDAVMQTNKMMSWMMPLLSISIAFVAPLGLALYWLVNNILMIAERLVLNKIIKTEED